MVVILFVIGIMAAFITSAALLKKNEIIENGILAFAGYWCIYIIVSGLLFWCDGFEIVTATAITLGIELIVIGVKWKTIAFKKWYCDIKSNLFPLLLCVIMLPFLWDKFELYGMGQDEGVYQTQAIAFLSGDTKNQQEIATYHQVSEEGKAVYQDVMERKLMGFYLYDETLPTLERENKLSEASGFYHGVPTFSAILALWGSVAGMEHMAGIQTLLYICACFLIFYIARQLGLERRYQNAAVLLFAISPIVVWVSKATLTEMVLSCIVLLFLYFLSERSERRFILLSILPILAFSFFHITIYTVLPAIVLVYFMLYLHEGKKEYLIAASMELIGFVAGIHMMADVAATYSFVYNFRPLYKLLGFVNQENVLPVLTVCGIMGVLVSLLLYISTKKRVPCILKTGTTCYKAGIVMIRLFVCLLLAVNMLVIAKEAMTSGLSDALRYSTLVGYGLFTGIVLLICAVFGMMIRADIMLKDKNYMLMGFMFFYCILIYAAIFRKQINYYYYYGRYLVPFIPCIILLGYMIISRIKAKWLKLFCYFSSVFIAFTMAVVYDTVWMEEKDDTRLSWDILSDCSELFSENDKVIVDPNMTSTMFLPLMHLTEAQMYIEYDELMNTQLAEMSAAADGGDIYFITDEYYGSSHWESVFIADYEKSEDDNRAEHWLPFPLEMQKEDCKVYVYRYYPSKTQYLLKDAEILTNNFYAIEGDARWTNGKGILYCYLEPAEYEIYIQQGVLLPLEELGRESMVISLYLNGECVDEFILNTQNRQEDIVFHVEAEDIQKSRNEVMIQCDAWSPLELGKSDTRKLGISIRAIEFK